MRLLAASLEISWWIGSQYTSLAKKLTKPESGLGLGILIDLLLGAAAENQKRGQT